MRSGEDFNLGDIYVIKDGFAIRPWGKTEKMGWLRIHVECEYKGIILQPIKKGESIEGMISEFKGDI